MGKKGGLILPILTLLLVIPRLSGDEKPLLQFLDSMGMELRWEPYRETARLSRGYRTASFKVGEPWLLLDFSRQVPCEPISKREGVLLLPRSTEETLRAFFFDGKKGAGPRVGAIFIDAGHGGKDPGTIGRHLTGGKELVLYEKDIVLETSLMLGEMLKNHFPGKQIAFSRTDDSYLTLEERPELANRIRLAENEAIVFISIHANASLNPAAKGFEVWYLPPDYRRSLISEKEVERESKEILPILNTMLEEEFTIESVLLAKYILKGLEAEIGGVSDNRGLKDESWFVVRKAKMPSVLVEIGFVTHPGEAELLADPRHLQKIAQAIYNGVVSFVRFFEETHERGGSP